MVNMEEERVVKDTGLDMMSPLMMRFCSTWKTGKQQGMDITSVIGAGREAILKIIRGEGLHIVQAAKMSTVVLTG